MGRELGDVVLEAIGDEVVEGIARPVDILLLQEQNASETTAYAALLNSIYGGSDYVTGIRPGGTTSASTGGVSVVYNQATVDLISEVQIGVPSGSGAPRAPVRYEFRPEGYDAAADFYIYNSHYKAGSSGSDQSRRQVEATSIRNSADALGNGEAIIYAGDFNMRSSFESAFQTLIGSGAGQAFDPINTLGTWNNNSSIAEVLTQSPAQSGQGLTTGGIDDRFDFQLTTGEVLDGEGFDVIDGTYRAFGNDGRSFNQAINTNRFNRDFPLAVLDALATAGDHLPVVVDYQLPASQAVTVSEAPVFAISGSTVELDVTVTNDAPVTSANAADELDYGVTTSGDLSGSATGQTLDAASAGAVTTVLLDTSVAGTRSGTVFVDSTSDGANNASFQQGVSVTVLDASNASFDAVTDVDTVAIDFGIVALGSEGGSLSETRSLSNLEATAGLTTFLV
ncbi:MAG: hypothetical protein AAF078_12430, partial [Planctomycetota bacterium]